MSDDFFDDNGIDVGDAAFWGGFVETQVEGEKKENEPDEPLSIDEILDGVDENDDFFCSSEEDDAEVYEIGDLDDEDGPDDDFVDREK